ncbi:MAG: aldehyde dehydrogenase [Chitinophagaceae bacterium]|nr:aldehyde dehydrogenase [Chitinophagaceae bacterium]
MKQDTLETGFDLLAMRKQVSRVFAAQKAFFDTGATRPYAYRKAQLKKLLSAIRANEQVFIDALYKDLRKSAYETIGTEIGPVVSEIHHTIRNLRDWMRPQSAGTPMMFKPSKSRIYPDPLGNVLIIGPWNYPFLLTIHPLVSAIAGGNTIILKPSDYSVHTSHAIEKLIRENFPENYIDVVLGPGPVVGEELIEQYHFDHIFFTGSVAVGKRIMGMAARHLSPVTLELGGKSPCIVDRQVNLDYAARKVAWSKLMNAGQTCVAPDYLLVHEDIKDVFIDKLKQSFDKMLGPDPQRSEDFGRMINRNRFDTVARYLRQGKIIYGGHTDADDLFIAPTILEGVSIDDPVMQEEIFGPVLPVIGYRTKEEVLKWIEANPYPLALYVYSSSKATADFFVHNLRFGGGCINNGVIHLGNTDIPFGGVGTSGIGQYNGKFGFDTFTRPKSVMYSPTWFDAPLWYAPHGGNSVKLLRKLFGL